MKDYKVESDKDECNTTLLFCHDDDFGNAAENSFSIKSSSLDGHQGFIVSTHKNAGDLDATFVNIQFCGALERASFVQALLKLAEAIKSDCSL